jgi:UDP-glucose 4-epimerase
VPDCARHPAATLRTNVIGTQNVLDALRGIDHARLVFASSAAVYGPSEHPLGEHAPLRPDDVYGTSKLLGEQMVTLAAQRTGGPAGVVVLRLFNTIGPDDPNPHLIPRLVSEARRGARRVRLGNLTSVRDYVYVDDVAAAVVRATEASLPDVCTINVGSGVGRSVSEAVEVLAQVVGRPLEAVSTAGLRRSVDRDFLVCDPAAARNLLDWEPSVPFATAIARTLEAAGVDVALAAHAAT